MSEESDKTLDVKCPAQTEFGVTYQWLPDAEDGGYRCSFSSHAWCSKCIHDGDYKNKLDSGE